MPYKIKDVNGFRVSGPSGVHAKRTTKKKAKAQVRVMEAAGHSGRKQRARGEK